MLFIPVEVKFTSIQAKELDDNHYMLRVHDLSGSVARHLSGRHSAPKGVPNETNGSATGEPKDEIRRNV
ncbi:MAG: hypothetical protein JW384_00875 [Nitrosomonadaceae bacterium]|nr:hypothetical protein [Nitrosomonadaceae bacterium]